MVPAREYYDNHQAMQYPDRGDVKTIVSCGTCHGTSHPELDEADDLPEEHGGVQPEQLIGCHACHPVVVFDTESWPHDCLWTNGND